MYRADKSHKTTKWKLWNTQLELVARLKTILQDCKINSVLSNFSGGSGTLVNVSRSPPSYIDQRQKVRRLQPKLQKSKGIVNPKKRGGSCGIRKCWKFPKRVAMSCFSVTQDCKWWIHGQLALTVGTGENLSCTFRLDASVSGGDCIKTIRRQEQTNLNCWNIRSIVHTTGM